jgi:hypothetical protein
MAFRSRIFNLDLLIPGSGSIRNLYGSGTMLPSLLRHRGYGSYFFFSLKNCKTLFKRKSMYVFCLWTVYLCYLDIVNTILEARIRPHNKVLRSASSIVQQCSTSHFLTKIEKWKIQDSSHYRIEDQGSVLLCWVKNNFFLSCRSLIV